MKKILPLKLVRGIGIPRGPGSQRLRILPALLTAGTLLVGSQVAHAQTFPINESFTGTAATTPNFTLGGTASLTGTATVPGYLRLTSAGNDQAGYAVFNNSFPSATGFSISFEFFSYGGTPTGADGLSVFLVDALGNDPTIPGQFNIGAYGGSLGYAQIRNAKTTRPGVSKGYLGIGLDEFGNYSLANEGREQGPDFRPQAVVLRGAGSGMDGYDYLTGSGTLPFTLDVNTPRAQPRTPDYRKAYLYVLPVKGPGGTITGYSITIRLQHGTTVTTTTSEYAVPTPPPNLRVGFAGSTGDFTNIHEVRNLAILDNPFAVDDVAQTPYNKPVTLGAVVNDRGIGADLDPTTVDLDPETPGFQKTYTVPEGTFTADRTGVVTFVPSGTFAGVVNLPYVVSDVVNKESNPAIMTVTVTGADLASSISGPASVNPSTPITYVVTTRNNGTEPASDVTPTLQLPIGTVVPASPSSDYTYDSSSGLLRFASIANLTATSSVTNSVTITAPEQSGSTLTVTSSFIYTTATPAPDPLTENNSATLSTAITDGPLPVELAQFGVAAAYRDALVTWRTATEQHNDYFTVERSLTGANFKAIGTVRSQGNGLTPHAYSFTDSGAGLLNAETVYYRLRQTDTNGTLTYSPVRSVRFAAVVKATATLYPNPSQGQTLLDLSSLPAGSYLVQVLDLTGRMLRTQHATAQTAALDLAGLPQGAYLVLIQGAGVRQALPLLRN